MQVEQRVEKGERTADRAPEWSSSKACGSFRRGLAQSGFRRITSAPVSIVCGSPDAGAIDAGTVSVCSVVI